MIFERHIMNHLETVSRAARASVHLATMEAFHFAPRGSFVSLERRRDVLARREARRAVKN